MRLLLHFLLVLMIAGAATVAGAVKPGDPDRGGSSPPNILFIAVDDLRPELGCYGVGAIRSPHIDRLAATGVRFDRAYCQMAVCNPSRVSLLTGLRPDSARVWDLVTKFRDTVPGVVTLPQQFLKHGYQALSFGKIFHNPWPDNVSWSEPHRWPKESQLWSEDARKRHATFREQMRSAGESEAAIKRMRGPAVERVDLPDAQHVDGAIAVQALAAMRDLANGDGPFFLAAGFVRPHLPFVVPSKYWELYERERIPLAPNAFLPRDTPKFSMNTMYELRDYMDYSKTADPRDGTLTVAQQRELKHGYYASVSFIDRQVGRLLQELERLELAANTIVVLWGDHGWKLGEHNSWCKQTNHEIDARVPLIIRDPRAQANGQESQALVELIDLYPTLCELAGIPVAAHAEGRSLAPLLDKPGQPFKEAAISQFGRRDGKRRLMGYSMRTERFRYVEWIDRRTREAVAFELYDHASDPAENRNLAADPQQEERLQQLGELLWKTIPPPPPFKKTAPTQKRPTLVFKNERKESLTVYWLPNEGERKKVGEIKPGGTLRQNTTKGHRFLVEGTRSKFRKMVTAKQEDETVVLPGGKARSGTGNTPARDHPNILFLMGDDWSWPHASILGDPVVKTPTFDRIAREGVLFSHAFVSSPSCTPSRFAVASGQYHWRLESGANLWGSLPADTEVYAEMLQASGYHIGHTRKGGAPSRHEHTGRDPFGKRYKTFKEFLAKREPGAPFSFWFGTGDPHRPYTRNAGIESGMDPNKVVVPACLPDNATVRGDLCDYFWEVQRFDREAGEILALLEKRGELGNTIVVMTGDNGLPFPRCKATLYDLGTRVPLAIRWGAKVKGGRTIDDFVSLTDLAPTFLEAVGMNPGKAMTGHSLLPALLSGKSGRVEPKRDHVLTGVEQHVTLRPARAIRTAGHLYVRNIDPEKWPTAEGNWPSREKDFSFAVDPGPTKWDMVDHRERPGGERLYQLAFGTRPEEELYDLRKDPAQMENVAGQAEHAEVLKRLRKRLTEGLRATGDPREE